MRGLLKEFTSRMLAKIFAAVGLVVVAGLVLLAWKQTSDEIGGLKDATRDSARTLADLTVSSIAYTMLQGDGIFVKDLVRGIRSRVPEAQIAIYDPHGFPVFGEKPAPPRREALPPSLRETLVDGERRVTPDGLVYHPIANEERCHSCHDAAPRLRGVLALHPIPAVLDVSRERILAGIVRAGFVHVMTARESERLDDYFAELCAKAPGLSAVAVYDRNGKIRFGTRIPGLPPELLSRILVPGAAPELVPFGGGTLSLQQLPKEERCAQCHKEPSPVRGALAVAFGPAPHGAAAELESTVDTSLRTIMLSSLGRMIAGFLRVVEETGAVDRVELFDDAGRTFFTSRRAETEPAVAAALRSQAPGVDFAGTGRGERVVVAQPLRNEAACTRCHGSDSRIRGVVTVSLSTGTAAVARESALRRTGLVTFAALAVILTVLALLLQSLVIRPVKEIGDAAEAIGKGDLEVTVRHASPDGDEMKRLGSRINEMVHGLRAKHVLERFVSRGTALAAHGAAEQPRAERMALRGERRPMVVLFSDVRSFTAYSERVPAEAVVEILNRFLEAQAQVVERHGGDIDKFAGDQLMALFEGEDAASRAVRCALEMIEAIDGVRRPGETLEIGVGVFAGDVIRGPIGSASRMDFTVVGDVVNTAARLCAAAPGSRVLAGAPVREAAAAAADLVFTELPSLALKGKREPLAVFAASRRGILP